VFCPKLTVKIFKRSSPAGGDVATPLFDSSKSVFFFRVCLIFGFPMN